MNMSNTVFSVEEENLICIYHNADRRMTMAGLSEALPFMDEDMQPVAQQTLEKLHNMTDTDFEEAQFYMTLSEADQE